MKDKQFRLLSALGWWALVFAGVTVLVLGSFYLDPNARQWVTQHQNAGVREFMRWVSWLGDWPGHVILGLVLLAIAYWRGSKKWMRIFAAMILACALAGVATRVVKISAGRARPSVQTEAGWTGPRLSSRFHSFPSGHTAASTAFFATLAFVTWRMGLGLMAIPLLIAFSRMYVAAHYLSDVVCAMLIGAMSAYVVVNWKPLGIENRESKIEN